MKDLVSIVMPTYNHGRYISRALDSVIAQTYKSWEAIIVDNYSTDNTSDIIASYSDSRIKHLKINNGGIIGVSRNLGLAEAKGDWIAFLDSDDWWEQSKLESSLYEAKNGAILTYHDLVLEYEQKYFFSKKISKKFQVKSPVIIDLLTLENPIATSSVLVNTAILKKVGGMSEDPSMVGAEDYNTWLKIAKITNQFKYIPRTLGGYRIHAGGVSKKDMSSPMKVAVADFQGMLNPRDKNMLESRLNYIRGRYLYLTANYSAAKNYLVRSLRYSDMRMKSKALIMLLKMKIF